MSLEYLFRTGDPKVGHDIGHGVTIFATEYDGQIVGIIEEHPGKDGARCSGYVKFRGRGSNPDGVPSWVVESDGPLTLSPSLLCRTCGHHGFIRGGKWVPA